MRKWFILLMVLCVLSPLSSFAEDDDSSQEMENRLVKLYPNISAPALESITAVYGSKKNLQDSQLSMLYGYYQKDPEEFATTKYNFNGEGLAVLKAHKIAMKPVKIAKEAKVYSPPRVAAPMVAQRSTALEVVRTSRAAVEKVETH